MKDQALAAITHWIETTSLPRKFADIIAVFTIGLLGGALYFAWNAESDIRRLAIQALNRAPELDGEAARHHAAALLADVQRHGGEAVAIWRVDLPGNTTTLVAFAGADSLKEKFPRLQGGNRVQFIGPAMPPAQQRIVSSLMTGNPDHGYYEPANVTLVACPVPNRSGSYLAGIAMAALPGKHNGSDSAVASIKQVLSDYSERVLR